MHASPQMLLPQAPGRLSALGQRWEFPNPTHQRAAAVLEQSLGVAPLVAAILAQRGLTNPTEVAQFLHPRLEHLPDPASLQGMAQALAVLLPAIQQQKKICIFGDYDVDGTCATALLTTYLRRLGVPVTHYLPNRLSEGYGPTPGAMAAIQAQGADLLITVDTGTNAPEALAAAAALGLPVVVTDHHPPAGPLPPAAAVLNPQRADDVSGLQSMCGSGVVFFLLMALNRALREAGYFEQSHGPEPKLTTYLDLVALATVADVMPLTGVNRILVAKGLQRLATGQHPGLAALLRVAGGGGEISAHTLGFVLGPRLNAAGRIESAEAALQLLLAADDATAAPVAAHLQALNAERQALEKAMLAEALTQAESQLADPETLALVLHAPHWHPGVVGIVASRVKEKTNRPCFVLGTDSHGHLKGSGRSAAGLNLATAVQAATAHLLSGGGHAAAAGVTLEAGALPAFRRELNAALWAQLQARPTANLPLAEQLAPTLVVAASLSPAALAGAAGLAQAEALAPLAPFGMGHPEPLFYLPQAVVQQVRAVGADGSHYRVRLGSPTGGASCEAMAFSAAETPLGQLLQQANGRAIEGVVSLKLRTFNGKPLLDLILKDARG